MNTNIEKEQTRRRQIMQRMDRMNADEGREDIDYTLASAFNGDGGGPMWKQALRQRKLNNRKKQQQQQQGLQQSQPQDQSQDLDF